MRELESGVLVVDGDCLVVPDLSTGEVDPIDLRDLLEALDHARGSDAEVPAPRVEAMPHRPIGGDIQPAGQRFELVTPFAFRLDRGLVFAWDRKQDGYVPIGVEHLETIVSVAETAAPTGSARALAELVNIGVIRLEEHSHADPAPAIEAQPDDSELMVASPAISSDHDVQAQSGADNVSADSDLDDAPEPPAVTETPTVDHREPAQSESSGSLPSISDESRLPGVFEGLPDGSPLFRARVIAYRVVGRIRRRLTGQMPPKRANNHAAVAESVLTELNGETPSTHLGSGEVEDLAPEPNGEPEQAVGNDLSPSETAPAEEVALSVDEDLISRIPDSVPETQSDSDVNVGADPLQSDTHLDSSEDGRMRVIPLYSWGYVSMDRGEIPNQVEPVLSIGMLLAHARNVADGRLNKVYRFDRIQPDPERVLAEWLSDPAPTVFMFSNYVWNVDKHLEWSALIKKVSPESLCLHGGPSCPKYEIDAERFMETHPSIDVIVRGEGEDVFVQLLNTLGGDIDVSTLRRLHLVPSLTYRDRSGGPEQIVRTVDGNRSSDPDQFPSPYVTGEFNDLLKVPWRSASVETNRGCPYGCTFCDWGSSMLSRIRKFDMERVKADLDWIMEHAAPPDILLTDANLGILARDVEVAEHIAELRRKYNLPYTVTISGMAKNTMRHAVRIIDTLVRAGALPISAQSIQTADPATQEAIRRTNMKIEKFEEMADAFRANGLPVVTDILMGLPGSTVESFKNDLQWCFDRRVTARVMEILLLPNSPMNEPSYREEYQIQTNEYGVVCGSSTFDRADYEEMNRIRRVFRAFDHFGMLRHVLWYIQNERGVRAIDIVHDIDRSTSDDSRRYPLLAFVARVVDIYTMPPVSWSDFYEEFLRFIHDQYGIEADANLRSVIELQRALMPDREREFPQKLQLPHDFVTYFNDILPSTANGNEKVTLESYGPTEIEITDPSDICKRYIQRNQVYRHRNNTTGNLFWVGYDWELTSPLKRHLVTNLTVGSPEQE